MKDGFNKFIGLIILLIVLTIIKGWFDYYYAFVWVGALIGYYLPFIDHLFYAYFLRPELDISKNIRKLVSSKKIRNLIIYVEDTSNEREKLIIHTAYFQIVFLLLTFFILTSSGSLFGRGLVYGFSLRLFVEQVLTYFKTGKIDKWFTDMQVSMDAHKTKVFLYANGLVILLLTVML